MERSSKPSPFTSPAPRPGPAPAPGVPGQAKTSEPSRPERTPAAAPRGVVVVADVHVTRPAGTRCVACADEQILDAVAVEIAAAVDTAAEQIAGVPGVELAQQ